jgi:hypothetical protein
MQRAEFCRVVQFQVTFFGILKSVLRKQFFFRLSLLARNDQPVQVLNHSR